VLLLDEIAARRWLTPHRADALTLEAVASGQLSVIGALRDHWQLITGLQLLNLTRLIVTTAFSALLQRLPKCK
jgi:hypothetical protein